MKDEKLEYKTKKKEGLTKLFSYQEVQMIVKKTGDKGPKITGSNRQVSHIARRSEWYSSRLQAHIHRSVTVGGISGYCSAQSSFWESNAERS
jgi:hypothetical protein